MTRIFSVAGLLALACNLTVAQDSTLPRTDSAPGASVYIISPAHGEVVSSPVLVKFGLSGMGVAPAGVTNANTGHHHLLIDVAADAAPAFNLPLPATDNVRHFGAGQTETLLELPPGEHTLQLVLGDHLHIPHNPPVASQVVHITVSD